MDARLWLCRISGTVVEGGIHNWPDVRMDGSRKLQAEAGWRDPEAWVFGEKQLGQVWACSVDSAVTEGGERHLHVRATWAAAWNVAVRCRRAHLCSDPRVRTQPAGVLEECGVRAQITARVREPR